MSLRLRRSISFTIQGDGSSTVFTVNLRQKNETKAILDEGSSPTGTEGFSIGPNTNAPTPPAITSATISGSILTVTFASALANAPASNAGAAGYNLGGYLLFEGAF